MNPIVLSIWALTLYGQLGETEQPLNLPIKEAQEAAMKGDFETALRYLQQAAANGSAPAAHGIGDLYLAGKGVEASLPKAVDWYQQAASEGHGNAMLRLGMIYHQGGEGVERDEGRARFHFQDAAEAGIPQGWSMLGQLSEIAGLAANEAPERKKHFLEAITYYEKGAEAGDVESQFLLAQMLVKEGAGEVDHPESLKWLRKSALAGNPNAMNELGTRLQKGLGTDADPVAALGWFLVAAERNHPAAMTHLGLSYANGIGVPVNHHHAGSWYDKAAKLNYAPAQFLIGQLFENGQGTEPKPVFAYVQYSRAAKAGHPAAIESRDTLKPKLSEEQLKKAEEMLSKKPGN
jgi:TPR repeat protein